MFLEKSYVYGFAYLSVTVLGCLLAGFFGLVLAKWLVAI